MFALARANLHAADRTVRFADAGGVELQQRVFLTSTGSAIHHAMLGVKFQERARAAGATCILRIEAQPTPEAFLIQHLKLKP